MIQKRDFDIWKWILLQVASYVALFFLWGWQCMGLAILNVFFFCMGLKNIEQYPDKGPGKVYPKDR
jgi:hypothetical protein